MGNLPSDLKTLVTKQGRNRIYLVNGKDIGKEHWNNGRAENEYEFGKFLFENGIHVPEMYELIKPNIFQQLFSPSWYILMQRIEGNLIKDLNEDEKQEALSQYVSEVDKVLDLGILPSHDLDDNVLFDRNQGRLYLIDFEFWEKASQEDINWFRNEVKDGWFPYWGNN